MLIRVENLRAMKIDRAARSPTQSPRNHHLEPRPRKSCAIERGLLNFWNVFLSSFHGCFCPFSNMHK